jgi:hypothetical protein
MLSGFYGVFMVQPMLCSAQAQAAGKHFGWAAGMGIQDASNRRVFIRSGHYVNREQEPSFSRVSIPIELGCVLNSGLDKWCLP